jgi:hypothetical protein
MRVLSAWQLGYLILIGSLFFIPDLDILTFLITFAVIDAVAYIVYFFLIMKVCKEYDNQLITDNNSE